VIGEEYRGVSVARRARFHHLQALEDAIAYRRARVAAPCADCGQVPGGRRCDDHACDLDLIAAYQLTARVIIAGLSRQIAARRAGIARQRAVSSGFRRSGA
jgi:hypothetical protein